MLKRRKTRSVRIGSLMIGSRFPVLVQSMSKVKTSDTRGLIKEIKSIRSAGCDVVRVAVKDESDACAISEVKKSLPVNIIADIHFDHRLALLSIENGADKIRLNPGNLFDRRRIKEVIRLAMHKKIPVRVGLNSGSVKLNPGDDVSCAMVQSALKYCRFIDSLGMRDLVVSLKASSVMETVRAYRMISSRCDYPLHLGVTASGPASSGVIKSALGIGALLAEGIGDTIRVSLTASAQEEVRCASNILEGLGLKECRYEIISCPTCGRCAINLAEVVNKVSSSLNDVRGPIKKYRRIAIMGCAVNGPGEARMADIGVAFGEGSGMIFAKGQPVKKVPYNRSVAALMKIITAKGK